MNVLIGYSHTPTTTAAYLQRALERRASSVTYVGPPTESRMGYPLTADLCQLVAGLSDPPDLYLYVDSGTPRYFPRGLTELSIPTACYLIDVHVGPKERFRQAMFFDYVFSAQRDFVPVLRDASHPQAHWLPLACDPEVYRRYDMPKRYDIGFVGATGPGYERRRGLLMRLADRFSINDYHRTHSAVEMAQVYSQSRIGFNCSLRREVNMRVFEGPATGTVLLTDRIGNGLSDLMADREHVIMYDDHALVELAAEYLGDEPARERIAQQGYEHVRARHTYDQRAETILHTVFGSAGPRLEAPHRHRSRAEIDLAYAEFYSRVGLVDDTIEQLKNLPPGWRYRLPAAKQVAFALIRRVKYD